MQDEAKTREELLAELRAARETIAALRESEKRSRDLFDYSPDAIFVEDVAGYVLAANPAACALHRMPQAELVGKHVLDLVPPWLREIVSQAFNNTQIIKDEYIESLSWTKDEQAVPVEIKTTPIEYAGQPAILVHVRDITQRKQSEAVLQLQNEYLAALHETTLGLINRFDLNELLTMLISRVAQLLDTPHGGIYLLDDETAQMVLRVGIGVYQRNLGYKLVQGTGLTGRVWETAQPLVVTHYDSWAGRVPGHETNVFGAIMGVPLTRATGHEVRVIGVLSVALDPRLARTFKPTEVDLLTRFGQLASVAIDNARLFQQAQQRAQEMATLAEISHEISSTLDLTLVLERIVHLVKNLLRSSTIALYLQHKTNPQQFQAIVALGEDSEALKTHPIEMGKGILGHVLQRGQPELVNYPERDPRMVILPDTSDEFDLALAAAPLISRQEVIGVVASWRQRANGLFTPTDLDFLIGLSRQATIALDNARLFQQVRREKRYFEAIVQNSPIAIVTIDFDFHITSWNPAAEKLFGYAAAEVMGQNLYHVVLSETERPTAVGYGYQVAQGGNVHTFTRRQRRDGSWVEVELFGIPVTIDDEVVAIVALYHDISEIQLARHEAEAANEAKSAFLASVSHELRTPLTSVLGFAKIIQKRMLDRILPNVHSQEANVLRAVRQVMENLEIIVAEGERLTSLINDVLDLAKIEAGRMEWLREEVDLGQVIAQATDRLEALFEQKGLQLLVDLQPNLPTVIGDRHRLLQVIINLLSNALKFTEQGEVICQTQYTDSEIVVRVIDKGVGISPLDQPKVFEKFKQLGDTLTDKPRGTGLGLPICQEIVTHHGGRIWVESEVGQGSIFSFTLPVERT